MKQHVSAYSQAIIRFRVLALIYFIKRDDEISTSAAHIIISLSEPTL